MKKVPNMKVIYLNNWFLGSWQVQKIHAQEFINAFNNQKGVQVFTYPKGKIISHRNQAVIRNKKGVSNGIYTQYRSKSSRF